MTQATTVALPTTLSVGERDRRYAVPPSVLLDAQDWVQRALPDATFVNVSDSFANVRTLKSDEEVALIDQANRPFDAGIERMPERVRPGMTGTEAVREAIQGMWAAGGDLELGERKVQMLVVA
jgi:Xaa-Pro aminopeptidase